MRIGLVTPRYAPAVGGVEKHVEILARGFIERGLDVEVITTDPSGELAREEVRNSVPVQRFPTVANDSVFYISPSLGRWLRHHAGRYALIHAHNYHTPLAFQAARSAKHAGIPFVVTPHYHGTGHSLLRKLMHIPYRYPGGWMLRRAAQIICVSAVAQGLIRDHFGLESVVIPNGVEAAPILEAQPHPREDDRKVVLAAGRIEDYKQVDRLVEAAAHLPAADYEVVIVGDGPVRPALQARVAALGLEDRVQLPGYISREELLAWFRTADVFISMSRNEAFGLAILEGAVGGAAVVASDIPAHREVAANYLPADVVTLIDVDAPPAVLAERIQQAQRPNSDPTTWTLPTWEGTIDGVIASYEAVLGTSFTKLTEAS
jgi:glycosyltransferase involved in cell wall biosynthesis